MNLEVFINDDFEIRVAVDEKGEPLFCLADICKVLELTNASMVKSAIISEFDDNLSLTYPIFDNLGREQKAIFITEPQLYFVLMRSDKPNAKAFRKWVNCEVLPSIRKTGGYNQKPLSQIEILQSSVAILAEQEKRVSVLEHKTDDLHKEQLKAKHNINRLLSNDNYMTLIAFMNLHGIKQKGYHLPSLGKRAKKVK
ncbi:BRO-N domain-containing protein [Campylobacter mucosalis]|uniref:BRO-N domain-containing protein n=1 Tax=Campylobacter mucosalis TaxID=202 RepID=UPI00147025EA|nr:BRO family protein [Campylobacter mucosalis]